MWRRPREWGRRESYTPGVRHTRLLAYLVTSLGLVASAAGSSSSPTLTLTPHPRMGFGPLRVHFRAELVGGDETEKYYCPEVEWTFPPDGLKATHEADCPPFDKREEFDRVWTIDKVLPESPEGGWVVRVALLKSGKVIMTQETKVDVRGGGEAPPPQ